MKRLLFAALVLGSLVACASDQSGKKGSEVSAAIANESLPRIVTILPFQNETNEKGIANQVRTAFYNHFSSKTYKDVELSLVDEKAVQLERSTEKSILDLDPQTISQDMACDGLVYGKVTDYVKVYAAVYSQLGVEAEVWLVDAKTGKELVRLKDAVRYHEGGVPMSPLGAVMTAVSTAMNIREIQQSRMVNELCAKLVEKIPSPAGIPAEDRPKIKEVITNVKEGPFSKGKLIRVGLEGDKGLIGLFDLGNFKKGILMKELKPGIYMGEYLVMPGDNTREAPLIAYLKKPGGDESRWIDAAGFVTIDTTPPPAVTELKAKGFHDRVEVSWEAIKSVPDLAGYSVLRSIQPLSGYAEVARVELNTYEDRTANPDTTYYYRVLPVDQTGNQPEPPDPVHASLVSKESLVLAGELQKDSVLRGLFAINEKLIVPKGMSLVLGPDTRVTFGEGASLVVYGKLTVQGEGFPVDFLPSQSNRWNGIVVDGGNLAMKGFRIKGASTAVSIKNAEGTMENGIITDNETGISVSGIPSVMIRNCAISGNRKGIECTKTNPAILQSSILQNGDGVLLKEFSGEIMDNNIYDNERNISSEGSVKIAANYLGSVNVDEMRMTDVTVARVYDSKYPGGNTVEPVLNPYAVLTPGERQQKAAELIIEGGNYFRQRNYGKSSTFFEEAIKASPSSDAYYYLTLCYQEMKEDDKALKYLQEGVQKYPRDSVLQKALGLIHYQQGKRDEAKKSFEEVLRLNPEDRQVKFLLERLAN